MNAVNAVNADQLAELEDERRFLLRSLRDLDAERAAGDVDDTDYETLRDGYTKRAADVLRSIEEGRSSLPPKQPGRWKRVVIGAAIVLVVAVGAGILVARSVGQRTPGQTITGGGGGQDTAGLLSQARAALGVNPPVALQLYQQILDREPKNPEALTYLGWLLYLSSGSAGDEARQAAVGAAQSSMGKAIAADPDYADPHCFLAVIATRASKDAATAKTETDRCLALDPPDQVRQLMEQLNG